MPLSPNNDRVMMIICLYFTYLVILPLTYIIFGLVYLGKYADNDISKCENIWVFILINYLFQIILYIVYIVNKTILRIEINNDFFQLDSNSKYFELKSCMLCILKLAGFLTLIGLTIWGFFILGKLGYTNCGHSLKHNNTNLYIYHIFNVSLNIIIMPFYFFFVLL